MVVFSVFQGLGKTRRTGFLMAPENLVKMVPNFAFGRCPGTFRGYEFMGNQNQTIEHKLMPEGSHP